MHPDSLLNPLGPRHVGPHTHLHTNSPSHRLGFCAYCTRANALFGTCLAANTNGAPWTNRMRCYSSPQSPAPFHTPNWRLLPLPSSLPPLLPPAPDPRRYALLVQHVRDDINTYLFDFKNIPQLAASDGKNEAEYRAQLRKEIIKRIRLYGRRRDELLGQRWQHPLNSRETNEALGVGRQGDNPGKEQDGSSGDHDVAGQVRSRAGAGEAKPGNLSKPPPLSSSATGPRVAPTFSSE